MLTSLLTQLLGKVAEAMLMHAKACNLPVFACGLCCALCIFWCLVVQTPWMQNGVQPSASAARHDDIHFINPLGQQTGIFCWLAARKPNTNTKARQWRECKAGIHIAFVMVCTELAARCGKPALLFARCLWTQTLWKQGGVQPDACAA